MKFLSVVYECYTYIYFFKVALYSSMFIYYPILHLCSETTVFEPLYVNSCLESRTPNLVSGCSIVRRSGVKVKERPEVAGGGQSNKII